MVDQDGEEEESSERSDQKGIKHLNLCELWSEN